MTKRFILVDSALDGPGGHYSTYAQHVLDAARSAGFSTLLVTRRDVSIDFPGEHAVMPALTRSFVDNFVDTAGLGAPLWAETISLASLTRDNWLGSARIEWRSSRILRRLCLLAAAAPALQVALQRRFTSGPLRNAAKVFSTDLEKVFCTLGGLGEDDLLFMPTISAAETLGVVRLLESGSGAEVAWRMLFRRDPCVEPDTIEAVLALRRSRLERALKQLGDTSKVRLFADTEKLTEIYRGLFPVRFTTATLPVVYTPKRAAHGYPLRITYLGDARTEKGFHLLPDIVDLTSPSDSFHYAVQTNPNTVGGEPACRAARPRLAERTNVSLLSGPLSDDDYEAALKASDIIILPYDPKIYRARSSGIFAEALAAGIPVIATAGTWMASQLQPIEQFWLENLATIPHKETYELLNLISFASIAKSKHVTLVALSQQGQVVFRRTRDHAPLVHFLVPAYVHEEPLRYGFIDENGKMIIGSLKHGAVTHGVAPSAVGLIVEPDAESIATGIEQISQNYAHFLKTAQENATKWLIKHGPDLLLQEIIS